MIEKIIEILAFDIFFFTMGFYFARSIYEKEDKEDDSEIMNTEK